MSGFLNKIKARAEARVPVLNTCPDPRGIRLKPLVIAIRQVIFDRQREALDKKQAEIFAHKA